METPRQIKDAIALHSRALGDALSKAEAMTVFEPMGEAWSGLRWLWMKRVRQDRSLNSTAKLVAHAIALAFADGLDSTCRPGLSSLMDDVGLTRRTLFQALADLTDRGWIVRLGGSAPGVAAGYQCAFPRIHETACAAI